MSFRRACRLLARAPWNKSFDEIARMTPGQVRLLLAGTGEGDEEEEANGRATAGELAALARFRQRHR